MQLQPSVGLYTVSDFMGQELPGLAILLDEVDPDTGEVLEPYTVLTVSFGEFISVKDSAYIDTNNCYFADQLLSQGIAENTGLYKTSGFCRYPLWVFKEEFLQEIGGEAYQQYATAYDNYYGQMDQDPDEELDHGDGPTLGM